jgi:hypothetical protein
MKVFGYILIILCLIMGIFIDNNLLPLSTEIAIFSAFLIFLIGIYILCITKDK